MGKSGIASGSSRCSWPVAFSTRSVPLGLQYMRAGTRALTLTSTSRSCTSSSAASLLSISITCASSMEAMLSLDSSTALTFSVAAADLIWPPLLATVTLKRAPSSAVPALSCRLAWVAPGMSWSLRCHW